VTVVTTVEDLQRIVREAAVAAVSGPRLLTKKAAAAYLSISERSLDDLVRTGEVKRVDLCGPKFDVRELDRVIAARTG
jgi:hypothetical protein